MRVLTKRRKPCRVSVDRIPKYRRWLQGCRCVACREYPHLRRYSDIPEIDIIDAAHTKNNGRGSKGPDSSCIPLCRWHHDVMDGRALVAITTKAAFAAKYGLNLAAEAAAHYKRFLEEAA